MTKTNPEISSSILSIPPLLACVDCGSWGQTQCDASVAGAFCFVPCEMCRAVRCRTALGTGGGVPRPHRVSLGAKRHSREDGTHCLRGRVLGTRWFHTPCSDAYRCGHSPDHTPRCVCSATAPHRIADWRNRTLSMNTKCIRFVGSHMID